MGKGCQRTLKTFGVVGGALEVKRKHHEGQMAQWLRKCAPKKNSEGSLHS